MIKTLTGLTAAAAIAALMCVPTEALASIADSYPIPASDADGLRGATVPYTRYDCNEPGDATLSGGATLERDKTWNRFIITSQASDQTYVKLPVGESVSWNMRTYGDGVTVRYTIADKHPGGHGQKGGYALNEGELEFYVNNQLAVKVVLNSYYMYHYFTQGAGHPSHEPSATASPAFAFDERHVQLNRMMKPGDKLTVKCTSGEEVGVDFVETEVVPEEIDPQEGANGRQVFNVLDYGAKADDPAKDNRGAFNAAIAAANKVGGIVYIPEGTWYIGMSAESNGDNQQGIWGFSAKNVKITGAGIWRTNIQFTGWLCFGGGVSCGNPTIGGTSDGDNIEFCHMYLNSNLCWRNEPQAVYKAFMDLWAGGSVIHDVWMEHFECGVWAGDYNNHPIRYCDGMRIVNCRIRNNLADGVNFCQGTSNAAVINCNVRNSGDDGLACWCNNYNAAKNETGNTFCYNTVEHVWRAGAIAIYGGKDQKVYNNWIGENFISAGFHCNDTFPGHGWGATADEPVIVENNYFVRAGSYWDIFNRNYGAIDLQQGLSNIIFRNNHMWECPAEAISIHDGQTNIVVDGLYVNGAGLSGQSTDYSSSAHSVGVGCFHNGTSGFTFNDFKIVENSVPKPTVGGNLNQYDMWPFWNAAPPYEWVSDDVDWAETPRYPDSEGIIPTPGIFEDLRDYDLVMTGIDWQTQESKHSMYDGDVVTFKVRFDNKGSNDIPVDGKFNIVISVDGKSSFTYSYKNGIAAGGHVILTFPTTWIATKGEHTFTATIDPNGKLIHETDRTNNVRTKTINVNERQEGEEPEIEINTHNGSDMGVVKVWFENLDGDNDEINAGDRLEPHAIVANYGSKTINLGEDKGVLWAFDSSPEYNSGMLWDDSDHTIAPGEYIDVTPNGGGVGSGTLAALGWNKTSDGKFYATAPTGSLTLVCRMDNPDKYNDDDASNNSLSGTFTYPKQRPVFNESPDKADNLLTGGLWDYEDDGNSGEPELTGFDLVPTAVIWNPGTKEVNAGSTINGFKVRVSNQSTVALPEGRNITVTVSVNGTRVGSATVSDAIGSFDYIDVTVDGSYVTTAGENKVVATVNRVRGESDTNNNSRERNFNAKGEAPAEPDYVYVNPDAATSTAKFVIEKVEWIKVPASRADNDKLIRQGDLIKMSATIRNNSGSRTPDVKHGIQWLMESGNDWNYGANIWNDKQVTGINHGETITLTSTGGNESNEVTKAGMWQAPASGTKVRAWFNDTHNLDQGTYDLIFPLVYGTGTGTIDYAVNPTGDDSSKVTAIETIVSDTEAEQPDVWYTLQGIRIAGRPMMPGIYIHNGKKVMIR